jgi:hypothetical protein
VHYANYGDCFEEYAALLKDQHEQLIQVQSELLDALREREFELSQREKAFELSTQRITTTVIPHRIKLDVGGHIFSVTLDMMIRYPESFFARLFSGRWEDKKTEDGAYFINRCGDLFHRIVNFLRNGEFEVELCDVDHRALCREVDFYQLKELMVMLVPWVLIESPNGSLSNNGLTFTSNTDWIDRDSLTKTLACSRGTLDGHMVCTSGRCD